MCILLYILIQVFIILNIIIIIMTNSDFVNLHWCLTQIEEIALDANEELKNKTIQFEGIYVDYNVSFEGNITINEITFYGKKQNDLILKLNEHYAEYFREY